MTVDWEQLERIAGWCLSAWAIGWITGHVKLLFVQLSEKVR